MMQSNDYVTKILTYLTDYEIEISNNKLSVASSKPSSYIAITV